MNNSAKITLDRKTDISVMCVARISLPENKKEYQMTARLTLDTGASFTALPASLFHGLDEQALIDVKSSMIKGYGITDNTREGINFYRVQLSGFSVEGMNFGSLPIYVTFEERYSSVLLGRDILGLLNYEIDNDIHILTLSKTKRFAEFQTKGEYLEDPYLLFMDNQDINNGSTKDYDVGRSGVCI